VIQPESSGPSIPGTPGKEFDVLLEDAIGYPWVRRKMEDLEILESSGHDPMVVGAALLGC